jgi:hypothetical protein
MRSEQEKGDDVATKGHEYDESHRIKTARNRALMRDVSNGHSVLRSAGRTEFSCECGDVRCNARLKLTDAEYESVRTSRLRFPIVPGHVIPGLERVIEVNERYAVVQKLGQAAESNRRPGFGAV